MLGTRFVVMLCLTDREWFRLIFVESSTEAVSLLNIEERSHCRLPDRGTEEGVRRGRWPPQVLRMDNGPEFISPALQQFCDGQTGMSYIQIPLLPQLASRALRWTFASWQGDLSSVRYAGHGSGRQQTELV
jgi:hypothetical protein